MAGTALAFLLRRLGLEVIIIELLDIKSKDKLCGGVMIDSASKVLKKFMARNRNEYCRFIK